MQNYIEYKANGISDDLKLQKILNHEWDFADLYKISDNEQAKIEWYDSLFGIDTKPNIDIKENFSNHLFYKYQPTNYSFLEYLFLKYSFSQSDHLFDFGVGCGRVIYMAAFYGCERISGCELNKDYYSTVFSSIKRNNHRFITSAIINIVNDDAQNIIFDSSINKFFFFNPFHLKIYIKVFKNNEEIDTVDTLQNKEYYLSLFNKNKIDKQKIYSITKKINDCLHVEFGIKNLYHRMIFTACALVAKRYGASLFKGMNYQTFHTCIHSTLAKSLEDSRRQNRKLDILLEVYSEIKMNSTENQEAIDSFIEWISEISECVKSDYWNGEDVMGIFFNEFNRYKKKSESGQIFTPEHITSLMYRIIDVHKNDYVLDAACGSGGFLVKSMSNMIKEAGGINTSKAQKIKSNQLYGIEFDREIFALACANMLIHKDGKTNLEQMDSRSAKAGEWIRNKKITKVLMNPPFERKYGCLKIVENVLGNVPQHTICAFILPDKKLEKDKSDLILKKHRLQKIIKLPEKVFSEGITTSIFVFEAGVPQNGREIFGCYIEDDGLETVKKSRKT